MTNRELAEIIATAENKAAYAAASDKSWFVQNLIEAQGIQTYPASPLCDYIEDTLET
jgi:hypothetical protein